MVVRLALLAVLMVPLLQNAHGQSREEIVRGDKAKVEAEGFWMYNDIPGAFAEARRTGKPIVVVLRCLPCEECVKLDDELVDTDPIIRPLLEQFVCVRQVATNGLDLDLFQYDTDQSFAVFFLNAEKTIYGRFGTRSHRTEWMGDVSLKGLAKALQAALDLHKEYPANKTALAAKRGAPMEVGSPEQYPSLKDKFTDRLNYEGNVVKSCIHCHQIGDAQREYYWHNRQAIPDKVLWPYPHPKVAGLVFDPNELATLKDVTDDSVAQAAGLQAGDEIRTLNDQPILSIADVQWVLHHVDPNGGTVEVSYRRGDQTRTTRLQFHDDWRRDGDLSWRVTTWGLRRIAAGGMVMEQASPTQRNAAGIADGQMALHVKRVGQYGPHGLAKKVGLRQGDIITAFDGRSDFQSEQDLLTYVVTEKRAGDKVPVVVRRNAQPQTFQLPIQR